LDRKVPKDPWGGDYKYKNPGEMNLPFSIMSYGADGKPGGEGSNADIYSWD
jgi:general secretion pathway protein G